MYGRTSDKIYDSPGVRSKAIIRECSKRTTWVVLEAANRELDTMGAQGTIRKVSRCTAQCPVNVVPKKSNGYRVCLVLIKVNPVIQGYQCIMLTADQTLGHGGGSVSRALGARSMFHQVKLADEREELSTFTTPYSRDCDQRLLFVVGNILKCNISFLLRVLWHRKYGSHFLGLRKRPRRLRSAP